MWLLRSSVNCRAWLPLLPATPAPGAAVGPAAVACEHQQLVVDLEQEAAQRCVRVLCVRACVCANVPVCQRVCPLAAVVLLTSARRVARTFTPAPSHRDRLQPLWRAAEPHADRFAAALISKRFAAFS